MVYAYIRVSTDKQTVENQRYEIQKFCMNKGVSIDKWIEETASGAKSYSSRSLGHIVKKMKNDTLICTELSRLGRSLFMIMEILSLCLNQGCKVYTIKDRFKLGDDIESKVIAFAFGLSAEIERKLISQRTKESLCRLKAEGKLIGRPKGAKGKHNKLAGKKTIVKRMCSEYGIEIASQKLGVSRSTIYRCLNTK